MKLTEDFEDIVTLDGREIKVSLFFDDVLRAIELYQDKLISDYEKWDILAEIFAADYEDYEHMSPFEKITFVQAVLKKFLSDKEGNEEGAEWQEKHYDILQDAEFIYASFLFDYNIDLAEQQGRLHWRKFIALLNGLSEKTKFREVVSIRSQKITRDMSKEQAANLRRLQQIYKLKETPKTEEEKAAQLEAMDNKGSAVAAMLTQKRRRGVDV
ncbi:bacteriophage Gp15 family protein [Bacillus spizizenii]|nr:bacteriophage Gp15 family protein [Bacillus spizizenii]MCY8907073.1 bacteriophage Gp15 family protein [Bacillus spizizenii]